MQGLFLPMKDESYIRGKSMMMISAGSKDSMLEFVQQTARIGLQLPASKFPFIISSELSCASYNRHKITEY